MTMGLRADDEICDCMIPPFLSLRSQKTMQFYSFTSAIPLADFPNNFFDINTVCANFPTFAAASTTSLPKSTSKAVLIA